MPSSSASRIAEPKRATPKVHFGALSPKSSQTLQRHRDDMNDMNETLSDIINHENISRRQDSRSLRDSRPRTRSSSDPPSSRLVPNHRGHTRPSASPNSSDDEDVVDLPSRFDSSGRPLDSQDRTLRRSRSSYGEFEYRPQHPGDLNMHGAWAAFPGHGDQGVARLAQTFGDLLEGQHGFLGALGHILQDGVLRQIA